MGELRYLVERHRDEIMVTVTRNRGRSVALFGSVARGEDRAGSDVDFLVGFEEGSSLFDLICVRDDLHALLGVNVDVVSEGGLRLSPGRRRCTRRRPPSAGQRRLDPSRRLARKGPGRPGRTRRSARLRCPDGVAAQCHRTCAVDCRHDCRASLIADLLVEIDVLLSAEGIDHAIGGALALNYYAEPRATTYVDVNVAMSFTDAPVLVERFGLEGFFLERPLEDIPPASGARLRRGADVVDLFFAYDSFHERLAARARRVPIRAAGEIVEIPILSACDLVIVKMSFNRGKDWVDIEAMISSGTPIDLPLAETEIVSLRGPTMYPRVARLRELLAGRG